MPEQCNHPHRQSRPSTRTNRAFETHFAGAMFAFVQIGKFYSKISILQKEFKAGRRNV